MGHCNKCGKSLCTCVLTQGMCSVCYSKYLEEQSKLNNNDNIQSGGTVETEDNRPDRIIVV